MFVGPAWLLDPVRKTILWEKQFWSEEQKTGSLIAVFKHTQVYAKIEKEGNNLFSSFILHSIKRKQFSTAEKC